jgi:hypothetical protein
MLNPTTPRHIPEHLNLQQQRYEKPQNSQTVTILGLHVFMKHYALRAGTPQLRFPMGSLGFFIDLILPAALWP